ncbi:hypothetical protein [Curtobacterium sp. MCSS17_016]|uniref:hypothetical protein n=1 Tax=Curtobacterium sp. MCSS17_016 TaxID=2175644 RepID=UPI000DA776E4|nr:hypothetical protein [Curtobacterium sp. MCSS17_016]WIE80987.1 hypothetical protein DEJ19_020940 [Curtobacterium sp. MCSS17_016]
MSTTLEASQWGLFTGPEGKQLVICNGEPCGPGAARKILSETPRRLLLDEGRVERFMAGDDSNAGMIVDHNGISYRIATKPIIAPWSGTIVGVFAGVFPVDEEIPEPPLVGSWEWLIKQEHGEIVGRRTFWNQDLFDLYEVDSAVAEQTAGYWEVDVWASELVANGDQLRFFSSLRDGYWDRPGVRCASFDAIAGYGTDNRYRKHLRLVAQRGDISTPEQLVLHGFSYQVPAGYSDRALAEEYPTEYALDGFMSLVQDPIAVVDPASLEVLMSTDGWKSRPFGGPRNLKETIGEDPADVRRFLLDAADSTDVTKGELHLGIGDDKQPYPVSVVSMNRGAERDNLAVVRLNH